jgi:hypothetical protein
MTQLKYKGRNVTLEIDRSHRALCWMVFVEGDFRMDVWNERSVAIDQAKQLINAQEAQ